LTTQSDVQYFRSVARLGVQVAEGLEYAHRQGIVHRDIKPSNLLLDLHGMVWITDFGLAKAGDSSVLTHTGDIVGTIRFMAPERLDGKSEPRSDIYGLGITLYELLTLAPAFADGQRGRLLERIVKEEPHPPRKLDAAIPRDLETILLKAIAKEPARRYATAEAMAEDLRRFLADRPIQARRTSWREKAWRWCRRNPGVASLSGTVAALLTVLAIGSALAMLLHRDKERAEQAEARAVKAEWEVQIRSHLNRAMAYRRSSQGGQRFLCLEEAAKALKLNPDADIRRDLSREILACLALPDLYLNPARPWADCPAGTAWVDFDDTLETYARTDSQGNCSIRRVADDQELMRLPSCGSALVHLSRNGRFAALSGDAARGGRLQVWKLDGPEPELWIAPPEPCGMAMGFRPDSGQFAVAHPGGAISVYDLATGERLYRLAPTSIRDEIILALHPTEPAVAISSYFSKVVEVRDLRTGGVLASLPHAKGGSWVAWHPGGHILATTAGDDTNINLYDRAGFKLVRTVEGKDLGTRIAFNHAGDRFVSWGWGGRVQLWDTATGRLLFSTPPVGSYTLRFSRDDRWLASAIQGNKVGIWQVSDGRDHRTLVRTSLPRKTSPLCAAVHKGGRLLAVGWHDGLGFWDLNTGTELDFVPIADGVTSLLFEPSGALLTNGPSHLLRWPVRPGPATSGTLWIGPPERLALPASDGGIAQSSDGRVLVQAQRAAGRNLRRAGAWVLHADRPRQPTCLEEGKDVWAASVSPDGRWITTVGYSTSQLWEASTGQRVKELTGRWGMFSPDGRWLATYINGTNHLTAVGSWTEGTPLGEGGIVAFSPDSRLVVLETGAGAVRLVESATGKEVARLEDPNLDLANAVFTPDGERLITLTMDRVKGIHVWDLKAVRHALRWLAGELDHFPDQVSGGPPLRGVAPLPAMPLRLDIDRTGLPEAAETGLVAWSLALALAPVNPVAHYRRALSHAVLRQQAQGIADCRRAAAWHPDWQELVAQTPARSGDLNSLAWWLVVKPASARDARIAVALAEHAVKLDPTEPT
jgi:WD40 repeat protein